ncbi:MAG: hypothetical protein M0P61_08555 [Ignavibacteriaceae bacterium]|nr:hypothetical protein [Ignavibacteriaceae bacterium]
MNKKYYKNLILIFFLAVGSLLAQRSDPNLRRVGFHKGNRVAISFYNDGQISGFNQGVDIRGEWPRGSGENYIGDCIPLIGVEFINKKGDTLHSVTISRGPRKGQAAEKNPTYNYFWGFNPMPGFNNPAYESKVAQEGIAMSHLPGTWPIGGWRDHPDWTDKNGVSEWDGYFGRGQINADQESYYWADDQWDDEFNGTPDETSPATLFLPDSTDPSRHGMGLQLAVRGFQWASFLAENTIFWLYDIKNEGKYNFKKADFGTVVGTLAGGDGDSGDDLGYFDIDAWITYSWDNDGIGNHGQKVGYVGYAFLESPGNPFDGIDNDDDDPNPNAKTFVKADFDSVVYKTGDVVVLIDPVTYVRSLHTVKATKDTVYSMGVQFIINPGVTKFREGNIASVANGVSLPDPSAYDGIDNDLDGLIDENEAIHFETRSKKGLKGLRYKDYRNNIAVNDPLIDERRDNAAGNIISSYVLDADKNVVMKSHFEGDEDGDWDPAVDDVGSDGVGKEDANYIGPDADGTEGNGIPDQGEPNFGRTDPDESDQIGLTSFNFFNQPSSPDLSDDKLVWTRMFPGRFDVVPPTPMDGDFIYASGYFPLKANQTERFSVALLFGVDYNDITRSKKIVQQIYNAGYKFPQPPRKPKITITQEDGNVVIYWDGNPVENSKDFISKKKDFQGYKIYRATDAGFIDSRQITSALGTLAFDKPIVQYDLIDSIKGFFYPSAALLEQVGGTTFYLGSNTGIVNKFIDSTVTKGQTYYYAVCSYDAGESKLDIFPSENSKFIDRTSSGQIVTDDNTGYITPGFRPSGYKPAKIGLLQKSANFRGTGSIEIEMVDDHAVRPNNQYQIAFQDTALQGYTSNWSLIDLVTPDTVKIPSLNAQYLVKPGETISVPKGVDIIVNGETRKTDTTIFVGTVDTVVNKSTKFNGETKIVQGFRVQLYNDDVIKTDTMRSKFEGISSTKEPPYIFRVFPFPTKPEIAGIAMPYDYQLVFSDAIADTSVADTLGTNTSTNRKPAVPVTFRVKNLTTGSFIKFVYFKTGTVSTSHNIIFKEDVQGKNYRTFQVVIQYDSANAPIESKGTLTIYSTKPFNRNDQLTFSIDQASIDNSLAKNDLDKIRVVPNPYVVTHDAESRLSSTQTSGRGEREIRFTRIPPGSKISIFTVRGELVKTLNHNDLFVGDVYWNLRTEENLDVAFGVYVFVVDAPNVGTKIGKFALIK